MENLSTAEKQKRKAMFEELIEAENNGIHRYVDTIKAVPEHRKMFQAIINEEFQHIRLLNELIKDLGEVPDMDVTQTEEQEENNEKTPSEQPVDETEVANKAQGTVVNFKRSK